MTDYIVTGIKKKTLNPAEQELKRIEEEIRKTKMMQIACEKKSDFSPDWESNKYREKKLEEKLEKLNQRKSDILLGLEAGRKEVFDEIEYMFLDDTKLIQIDESEWKKLKSKLLGEKE